MIIFEAQELAQSALKRFNADFHNPQLELIELSEDKKFYTVIIKFFDTAHPSNAKVKRALFKIDNLGTAAILSMKIEDVAAKI